MCFLPGAVTTTTPLSHVACWASSSLPLRWLRAVKTVPPGEQPHSLLLRTTSVVFPQALCVLQQHGCGRRSRWGQPLPNCAPPLNARCELPVLGSSAGYSCIQLELPRVAVAGARVAGCLQPLRAELISPVLRGAGRRAWSSTKPPAPNLPRSDDAYSTTTSIRAGAVDKC